MTTGIRRIGALAVATAMLAAACSTGGSSPSANSSVAGSTSAASTGAAAAGASGVSCGSGSITAVGSTALQPLVDAAGKAYTKACPGATINVQGGGSGTGLTQVAAGAVQIGDSDVTAESKLPAAQASSLVDHVIAKQGWIMVNNLSVTGVTNLTTQQATDIWTGKITNWNQVGGPNQQIVVIIRPQSSGTRATFKQVVLHGANETASGKVVEDSNGAVTAAVESTPGSTSVIGFAYYQDNKSKLAGLQLDGVDATVQNMTGGSYKLAANGNLYTKGEPTGLTKAFLDYMLGSYVQGTLIPSMNYAPVAP